MRTFILHKPGKLIKLMFVVAGLCFLLIEPVSVNAVAVFNIDLPVTSTQKEAIDFVDKITELDSSAYWPNIKPRLFLKNLKSDIYYPVSIYPGNGTNFCGYGALTYLFLQDDPLGYARLLLQLYKNGNASFGKTTFNPSCAVRIEAGLMKFKGVLDIHPAEQMWFLCLADHFKGYLNFFNRKYDPGDENTFWASVNFAKFNHMVKGLLQYTIKAKGSDILHPSVKDLCSYIKTKTENGKVVLFINNRIVHKKNHVGIKLGFPTHFIVVERISEESNVITLVYWDYGGKTQIQISPDFLKKIVFGVSYCTKIITNEH